MPYLPNPNDPNAQQPGQNPITTTAPGAGPAPGGKASSGTPNNQAPTQPFTNLSAYLNANAPQIQNQANVISGQLTNQYGQVQGDVNAAQKAFDTQVQGAYAPANPDLVSRAAANPSAFVQNPADVAAFQGQLNDKYTGPTGFQNTQPYANINSEVNNAVQQANLVNSYPGLQTYLQQTEVNPTQGETTLDAALLGANPQAVQQIQQAAQPFTTLPSYLSNAVATENQNIQNAQQAAQGIANTTQTAFTGQGGVVPNFQAQLQNELETANSGRAMESSNLSSMNQDISARLAAGQPLTDSEMSTLGLETSISPTGAITNPINNLEKIDSLLSQGQQINLSNYLTPGTVTSTAPQLATVATPQDYATMQALITLLNQNPTQLVPSMENQAGTYSLTQNNPSFDVAKALAALQGQGDITLLPNQQPPQGYTQLLSGLSGLGTGIAQPNLPPGTQLPDGRYVVNQNFVM